MRLLVDSHVLLWWLHADRSLNLEVVDMLRTEPDTFVSAATVWEISIKQSLGKLDAPVELGAVVVENGFHELAVTFRHAVAVRELPAYHKDPFDRMLIAQARTENLTLVTHDRIFEKYDVPLRLV